PYPVITGFTIGIAIIIFLQQVPGLLDVTKPEGEQVVVVSVQALAAFVSDPSIGAPVLGLLTMAVMLVWDRLGRLRGFPASMAALAAVTAVSLLPMFDEVARVGHIPAGLPTVHVPGLGGLALTDLVRAGVAIAILAALESLLSAVVADGMTVGERHDPDRELFGQGLANIGSALAGGIPATAALARTAVNVRSGARTRLAAIIHAIAIGVIVLSLATLVEQIPLSVLAGILMVVAVHMVEGEAFHQTLRSTKSDAATMLLTLGVTLAFDLILAIEVGMIAAGALFIARMSRMFQIDLAGLAGDGDPAHEDAEAANAERAVRAEDLVVFRIDGPIFFGAADRFFDELLRIDHNIRGVVLRLRRVPVMDMTGAAALGSLVKRLERRHVLVFLSGVQDQPRTLLRRTGILQAVTRDGYHLFDTTDEAIAHARLHLRTDDHIGPATARQHPHPHHTDQPETAGQPHTR
ncbi:MAG TPA: SulP family inorganic anion transporter, partial [Euzebya sp.]|nr:SulP family inorganic anion transporter [Euzebya sp.]